MNKLQLVETIVQDVKITKVQANAILDSFIETITRTLQEGQKVTLVGLGTFTVSKKSSRTAFNPQTGQVAIVQEKKLPKFKAGKQLLDSISESSKNLY